MIGSIEVVEVRREPPVFRTKSNSLEVCPVCWPNRLLFLCFPDLLRIRIQVSPTVCPVCSVKAREPRPTL